MRKPTDISAILAASLVLAGLSACSPAPMQEGVSDPWEAKNRQVHNANLQFDRAFFGPASRAYGNELPAGVRKRVSDFSANTALPSIIVNDMLQGNVEDAVHNAWRLVFNTTLGLGGLFDVATGIGLEERGTDFGQTLHKWGVPEGNYVVLPLYGPSTERDAAGTVVDWFTNPLSYTLPGGWAYLPTATGLVAKFDSRYTFDATFDELFYASADSYATARLYYLDNRRYRLSPQQASDDLYDLYEEAYE